MIKRTLLSMYHNHQKKKIHKAIKFQLLKCSVEVNKEDKTTHIKWESLLHKKLETFSKLRQVRQEYLLWWIQISLKLCVCRKNTIDVMLETKNSVN